tara:strand:+ start:1519 stop:1992 length:474 start_codon:yes stop_codon:yes gene_type:complete
MSKLELSLRTLAIAMAIIVPIICISTQGLLRSYSQYWETPMQPFFIISNVVTAYYFFEYDRWKPSACLLLLLTAFSVSSYGTIHNVLAVLFFVSSFIALLKSNHYSWAVIPYTVALILLFFNMMLAETLAISVLALYHGLILYKIKRINKQKQINHE